MKILVLDDNKINRAAARAQLKEHELVIVETYDEAQKLLTPYTDRDKINTVLEEEFGDFSPYRSDDEKKKSEYFAFLKKAVEQATTYSDFDVVLTDLLMPASSRTQSNETYIGKEMPVGIFIGFLAATKGRARYVAVFTDSNHHAHPASACFDAFNEHHWNGIDSMGVAFEVAGAKVILCNNSNWVNQFDPNNLEKELKYEEYSKRSDTVKAKNWREVLKHLIES